MKTYRFRYLILIIQLCYHPLHSQIQPDSLGEASALLLKRQVESAYNNSNTLMQTPASIFIIDQNDIRQMGAVRLQDVFLQIPGFWADDLTYLYSTTGLRHATSISNPSMLVYLDGMLLNNPLTAGMYYPLQQVPLAHIDKIEVLKGNWGARYGWNSGSGIINIYTKKPGENTGMQLVTSGGSLNAFTGYVHYGQTLMPDMHASAEFSISTTAGYPKNPAFSGASVTIPADIYSTPVDSTINNHFPSDDIDGRLTYHLGLNAQAKLLDKISTIAHLQFNFNQSKSYTHSIFQDNNLPFVAKLNAFDIALSDNTTYQLNDHHYARAHLDLRFLSNDTGFSGGLNVKNMMFDLDMTDHWNVLYNDLTFGLKLQSVATSTATSNIRDINFYRPSNTDLLYGAFFQDRIHYQHKMELLLGLRAETWTQMSYKPEIMPNIRLAFYPGTRTSFWGAFGRTVVAPGYWETHLEYRQQNIPYISAAHAKFIADQQGLTGPERAQYISKQNFNRSLFLPGTNELYIATVPSPNLKASSYNSYEFGMRKQFTPLAFIDVAGYFTTINNGIAIDTAFHAKETIYSDIFPNQTVWPLYISNSFTSDIVGGEVLCQLQPRQFLKLLVSYSFIHESRQSLISGAKRVENQNSSATPRSPMHVIRFQPTIRLPRWGLTGVISALWASETDRGMPFNYITQTNDYNAYLFKNPPSARVQLNFYGEKSFFDEQLRVYIYGRDIIANHKQRFYSDQAPIGFPHTVHRSFGCGLDFHWQVVKISNK